jgi:hypothetical protein
LLDSLGLEVRTFSKSDFLDFEGLLAFNILGVLPSTLLASIAEVIHEETPQNVPVYLLMERSAFY